MSGTSQYGYSLSEASERSSAFNMLKARLPTQREIKEILHELESLRKDKKLKDDTIKFLQKEKETLKRELKHYEQICDGVVSDVASHKELEAENAQLTKDILHLKDVIRRQNMLLRNTGTSGSSHLDRQLVSRLCANLLSLLAETKTNMSTQIYQELEHQKETLERANPKRGDTTWQLLEVIDRALIELKSVQTLKSNQDLPDISKQPPMKYSQPNPLTEEPKRRPMTNLTSTSSASLANLNSNETLLMAGHAKRRGGNPGKLGRLGRLERSKSAPSLNGRTPKPPATLPPSACKSSAAELEPSVVNSGQPAMLESSTLPYALKSFMLQSRVPDSAMPITKASSTEIIVPLHLTSPT